MYKVFSTFDGFVGHGETLDEAEWVALQYAMEEYDNMPDEDLSYMAFCIVHDEDIASDIDAGNTHVIYSIAFSQARGITVDIWDVLEIDN